MNRKVLKTVVLLVLALNIIAVPSYLFANDIANSSVSTEDFFNIEVNTDGANTCTIIGYNSLVYTNIIPSTINGYTVTRIGDNALKNVRQISGEVIIPDSIISIGDNAFYECTNLTILRMGKSLKTIGSNAFYGCTILTSIRLNSNLEKIGDRAFYRCTALKNATLSFPVTLNSIGNSAFFGTEGIIFKFNTKDAPTITNITFDGCKEFNIVCPIENNGYTAANYWPEDKIGNLSGLIGDLNGDNIIDSTDAAIVLTKYKNNTATTKDLEIGDMNGDGIIDSVDAAMILTKYKNS